jgi:lipoprotein-anchoring transpeptidase ErfK/SrfK
LRRPLVFVLLGACAGLALLDACANGNKGAPGDAGADATLLDVVAQEPSDATADAARDRGALTKLAAANFQVSVVDRPAWPESNTGAKRLGYLRSGAVVTAYDTPIPNDDCKDGWFELERGGYVCGKAITLELTSPRVRLAPKGPDRDAGMPYRYGVNLTDGTPLYRRVLNTEDRKKYEPWLAPPKEEPANEVASSSEGEGKVETAPPEEEAPSKKESSKDKELDAGKDASKPKLKELRGRGVLVRKMAKGFYLALDRDFKAAGAHWWRTTFGFATPFDRIMLQQSVTKHVGEWWLETKVETPIVFDAEAGAPDGGDASIVAGTVGFIANGYAHEVEVDGEAKKAGWGKEISKRSSVLFTGKSVTVNGTTYHQTANGFYLRASDVKLARPQPPADLAPNEKWIDVDLTRQALVAFEGMRPVFATLISSGRRNPNDKEKDFPTPAGSFRIREKHVTTTMDGDVASDGPYSIEDVPWVMYFQGSYALHGAFWHDAFGWPRSHGCVNMSPEDARTLFAWADPQLPEGWHGVFSPDDQHGTRVIVHEDPQPKHRRRASE